MSQAPFDPYLLWAQSSEYRGYKQPRRSGGGERLLPVAIELPVDATVQQLNGVAEVPKAYLGQSSAFATATVPESKLDQLAKLVTRFKLGLPSTPSHSTAPNIPITILGNVNVPVLAFIDHGIGFLNQRFWTASGGTRIRYLWDQEDARNPVAAPWQVPKDFAYGRELPGSAIEKWRATLGKAATEHDAYRLLDYSPCHGRMAHGTHVMDLACGGLGAHRAGLSRDLASMLKIIAVQLPWKPFKDTSSSSLCVHILDGLRYILQRTNRQSRVVVNISDGAYAGSHYGNSLLECAIDDLLITHENLTVVIAAGNGFEQKLHGHWSGAGLAPPLKWRVLPDTKTDSFLDIWCSNAVGTSITVTSPAGVAVNVKLGECKPVLTDIEKSQVGGIYSSDESNLNGADRAMFLVALAPTKPSSPTSPATPHGVWTVEVNGSEAFDAYIQRNNPALGDKGPRRQSYFVDDREKPRYVTGNGTLNNIATGERPIVVGGYYLRGHWFDPATGQSSRIARYSSAGPGRKGSVQDVNALAPSEDSPVLHGLLASGVRSGTMVRMDGTSVAAPIVTRFIANSYAHDAAQTVDDLQSSS